MKIQNIVLVILLMQTHLVIAQQSEIKSVTTSHKNGTLMVIGGGKLDSTIFLEFKKYAGGDTSRIVVIPTALPDDYLLTDSAMFHIRKGFEKYGFDRVTILHTRDTVVANTDEFIEPLKTATGLYFLGGRQWRIADGFLHTKAHKEMFKLLDRGGVIAGSSAGATIQGSYLARGDTETNQIMMGNHEEGLGFITNIAIDQHVLARNRQFDMFDILKNRPELLGIGLDENTAIVVHGDEFEVIGASYVVIYDGTFWSREGSSLKNLPMNDAVFYMLKNGDSYNLRNRKVIVE